MSILWDTHIHTDFSTDSETPLAGQLARAGELGLAGLCITDHMDYDIPVPAWKQPLPEGEMFFCFNWEPYVQAIREEAEKSPLTVYTGVECGLQTTPSVLEKNRKLREKPELDYMIGSLHLVDGQDPYYSSYWEGKDPGDCILHYFEILYENLQLFHDFDAVGHLDYIVRYAPSDYVYDPREYEELLDAILTYLIQKDIALEVNSSGWKKEGRCQNPHLDILRRYRELGGELITIGSDAHAPEYVAYRFADVKKQMEKAGLHHYVVYSGHKPVFYEL